jgi:hypothetical protein
MNKRTAFWNPREQLRIQRQNLLRPVAWGSNHLGASSYLAAAGKEHATFRMQHLLLQKRASRVRLLFTNWNGSITGPQAITVSSHVQVNGYDLPVTFGGARTVSIGKNCAVLSDEIPITLDYRDNHGIYTMTYVDAGVGGRIPIGRLTVSANGEGNNLADATAGGVDLTVSNSGNSGTLPSFISSAGAYSPAAILGIPEDPTQIAVCAVGDSVVIGAGDSAPTWSDGGNTSGSQDYGFIARALCDSVGPKYGLLYNAKFGDTAQAFSGNTPRQWQGRLYGYCTDVVEAFGTNDVNNTRTAAQIEADRTKMWRDARIRGPRVWACTILPRSTSSDSWVTVNNQTAHTNDAARVAVNTWLLAGAPLSASTFAPVAIGTAGALVAGDGTHPLSGVFDTAAQVESSLNSGKWKANYTVDGVHPNNTAHAAMAPAINLSLMT